MKASTSHAAARYQGEVRYLFAFDIADDLHDEQIRQLLGQPLVRFVVGDGKRSPKGAFFAPPPMIQLPSLERIGPQGPIRVERAVKLFAVGAISISVRVPFRAEHLQELVAYHDLHFGRLTLTDEVRQLAEQIRQAVAPHCVRPVKQLADEDAYTVFCLAAPLPTPANQPPSTAADWLQRHRRIVAGLLMQEANPARLADQEIRESTERHLSYYQHDLVVVDWDAALLVDEPPNFDETIYIMELANVHLAELEAYDRLLDDALSRSYRDLVRQPWRHRHLVMRELRELRIDLTRMSDELLNITKFFGDWHLARLYQNLSGRFHLADWHGTIDGKLDGLDSLYQLLQHDQNNRWMLILEATIVLLFIIDLVLLFLLGSG